MRKKLIITLILLSIISIINNYYARYYLDSYSNYYIKQIIWFLLGFLIIYLGSKININYILNNSKYLYIINNILLILTLIIGININGSKSWINILGLSFQPSEFMKISLIIYLRYLTINKNYNNLKYLIIITIITLIPSILVFLEPDTGPIISYITIYLTFLFLRKFDKKYYLTFISIISLTILIFIYLYYFNNNILLSILGTNIYYRLDRLTSFINNEGYQISTAIKSISLSNLVGIKKRVYFPEAATDFAITLLISNFGILGLIFYLIFYLNFIYLLNNINKDRYIIKPTINFLIVQSSINLLMNIGLFPIVGITYPLLSYGGSSLLSTYILISIIYNMDNMDYSYNHHNNYNHIDQDNKDNFVVVDLHKQV